MIRAVLVDNEKPLLDELAYLLSKHESIQVVDMFTSSVDALKNMESLHPDVVFLDIDMPVLNGMNLARELFAIIPDVSVVFVTAFDHYAVQAFEVNAIDYLLKPISSNRLHQTVNKLSKRISGSDDPMGITAEQVIKLEQETQMGTEKIVIYDNEEYHVFPAEEILYIEAQRKETHIVTARTTVISRKSLDQWESQLKPQGFFRCHRSFIVNLKHVKRLSPMFNGFAISQEGTSASIPVSKSNFHELKKLLHI